MRRRSHPARLHRAPAAGRPDRRDVGRRRGGSAIRDAHRSARTRSAPHGAFHGGGVGGPLRGGRSGRREAARAGSRADLRRRADVQFPPAPGTSGMERRSARRDQVEARHPARARAAKADVSRGRSAAPAGQAISGREPSALDAGADRPPGRRRSVGGARRGSLARRARRCTGRRRCRQARERAIARGVYRRARRPRGILAPRLRGSLAAPPGGSRSADRRRSTRGRPARSRGAQAARARSRPRPRRRGGLRPAAQVRGRRVP